MNSRQRPLYRWFAMLIMVALMASLVLVAPASAAGRGSGRQIPVSGCTFPLNDPPSAISYIGRDVRAERDIVFALLPCPWDPYANGFLTFSVQVHEIVERLHRASGPVFTMIATQTFDGQLFIRGSALNCHISQTLTAKGPLDPAFALDDDEQSATALTGTWVINRGSTCDGRRISGEGTIFWAGGATFPTYSGWVALS